MEWQVRGNSNFHWQNTAAVLRLYTALAAEKPILGAEAGKPMANDALAYFKACNGIQAKLEGRVIVK